MEGRKLDSDILEALDVSFSMKYEAPTTPHLRLFRFGVSHVNASKKNRNDEILFEKWAEKKSNQTTKMTIKKNWQRFKFADEL